MKGSIEGGAYRKSVYAERRFKSSFICVCYFNLSVGFGNWDNLMKPDQLLITGASNQNTISLLGQHVTCESSSLIKAHHFLVPVASGGLAFPS